MADGTAAYDNSGSTTLHTSERAVTMLTKVLVSDSAFADVRSALRATLTDHGRAVLDRLVEDLACQVLDVREPGHACEGCPDASAEGFVCYCNAKGNVPHTAGTNGCAYA